MTDESTSDHIHDMTKYTRIGVPNSDELTIIPSGSYLRLGQYVDDEASYAPSNFLKTEDGTKNTPSTSNASGLFLKTDGVLFLTIDSTSYQSFGKTLSIYSASGTSLASDGPQSITGTTLTATSTDGKVTISAATSVDITANKGSVTTTAKGNHSTKVFGDKWAECKGTWKSLSYGRTYTAFVGSSIDFYVGDVVKNFGGLFLTTVNLFFRFTLGIEFVMFGVFRMAFGTISMLRVKVNILAVNVKVENGDATVINNSLWYKKVPIIVQEHSVNVRNSEADILSGTVKIGNSDLNMEC